MKLTPKRFLSLTLTTAENQKSGSVCQELHQLRSLLGSPLTDASLAAGSSRGRREGRGGGSRLK